MANCCREKFPIKKLFRVHRERKKIEMKLFLVLPGALFTWHEKYLTTFLTPIYYSEFASCFFIIFMWTRNRKIPFAFIFVNNHTRFHGCCWERWGSFAFDDNHETACMSAKPARLSQFDALDDFRCRWTRGHFPSSSCTLHFPSHGEHAQKRLNKNVNSICRLAWRCYGKLLHLCLCFV